MMCALWGPLISTALIYTKHYHFLDTWTQSKMGKLDGKVALITGGSDGIGLATAQRFLAEGAEHVFITGRRQQLLDEAVKKLGGNKVTAVQCDASKQEDIHQLYALIKKEQGTTRRSLCQCWRGRDCTARCDYRRTFRSRGRRQRQRCLVHRTESAADSSPLVDRSSSMDPSGL